VAVASPEVAALVVSGIAETGPRNAEAFSMPGASPVARPAVGGGGGENGWAGGVKLVIPGAAGIGVGGRGIIGCAIGGCALGGTGGGVTNDAGGGANIPADDCDGTIVCAGAGGATCCTAANGCTGALVAGALATEDPDDDTALIAAAGNAAAGDIAADTPVPATLIAACIPLSAAPSANDAAAATPAPIAPPEIAGIEGVISAEPSPSNAAPYRTPAPALLGHINPKYSRFKSAIRGVNAPNTIGLITSSVASSNRFACAGGAGTICVTVAACAAAAICAISARANVSSANVECSPLCDTNAASDAVPPTPTKAAEVPTAVAVEIPTTDVITAECANNASPYATIGVGPAPNVIE
jgi:hypothetical protein